MAAKIRAAVEADVGVTCSAGVASTKFVAKLASAHCKPDGLLHVPASETVAFLEPLLPAPGVLTKRGPTEEEQRDLDYGYNLARELGRLDIGQTVVVSGGACVAVEAMEGTDAVIERAASLVNDRPLRVVKLAKPNQDLRFDVPVIGARTIEAMIRLGVTALAIEARKTLMIDRGDLLRGADAAAIAIVAVE